MPVITVSRLTGSGGATIGQRLAEHLGASYLNTQIIREVAHRLGISEATAAEYNERAEAFIERLARVLWLSNPVAAVENSLRSNAALAVAYRDSINPGSSRRRTSVNAERMRGDTSLSDG